MTQIEVLLPIKSPAPWLEETLESLKFQTHTDWRLVVNNFQPIQLQQLLAAYYAGLIRSDQRPRAEY